MHLHSFIHRLESLKNDNENGDGILTQAHLPLENLFPLVRTLEACKGFGFFGHFRYFFQATTPFHFHRWT